MRRLVMLALPLLAACSSTPAVSPTLPELPATPAAEPLPPLRAAFLGETLRLQGQLSDPLPDRLRNETLALVLEVPGATPPYQVVGTLRTDGTFEVEATSAPTPTTTPEQAFSRLPLNSFGGRSWCEPEALEVSDAAARLFVVQQLSLRHINAQPLLSPGYPSAGLTRWLFERDVPRVPTWVHLVYTDRDVLVRGQKACRYEQWTGGTSTPPIGLFSVSANLDLRRGWNEVRVVEWGENQNGLSSTRRVVSGHDSANSLVWKYNNGAMPAAPVSLP